MHYIVEPVKFIQGGPKK